MYVVMEKTLAIIKPYAVAQRVTGQLMRRLEEDGFLIRALRMVRLSEVQAEGFYALHSQKPFFVSLTAVMSSGPVVVLVLVAEEAIR